MRNDPLLSAVSQGVTVFDLARPYAQGMPQSPNHAVYTHSLQRRHGDMVRADGGSAANDVIVMGTHVGTHIDALAHVSQSGFLHDDVPVDEAMSGPRFGKYGIDQVQPMITRGILIDIPKYLGIGRCEPGYEITPEDLENALKAQNLTPRAGDVLLVRSGWGQLWGEPAAYVGAVSGVPGVSEAGARWLASHSPVAVGADTIAFEQLAPGKGHAELPAHRVLLVETGINIIETMALEELSASGHQEFTIVVIPLTLVGATGSPVRPLALVGGAA